MSNNVKVSDFEDMNRPLARAAINQGWILKWTANGHIKFIPPKGPSVVVSKTNAAYTPNLQKLREAGLTIPYHCLPQKPKEPIAVETVTQDPPPKIPKEPEVVDKKKMNPRGSVKEAVMAYMKEHPETAAHVDIIHSAVMFKLPGVTKDVVATTCSQAAARSELIRVAKGTYRYAGGTAAVQKKELSKEEQEMLSEDQQIFDEFMDALAKMQEWANRMRDKSIALARLKKLLGGL